MVPLSHAVLDEDSDITDKHPAQSAYFTEAEKNAQVPFLHHQLFECDCNSQEYTIEEHDITLRIPEGAVSKGEKIHFEIDVAMHGPFTFHENMRPISPVVWLCILEEGVDLKKPFQLILPHFLTGLSREHVHFHQIQFAKAITRNLLWWIPSKCIDLIPAQAGLSLLQVGAKVTVSLNQHTAASIALRLITHMRWLRRLDIVLLELNNPTKI